MMFDYLSVSTLIKIWYVLTSPPSVRYSYIVVCSVYKMEKLVNKLTVFCLIFYIYVLQHAAADDSVVVQTKYGKVRGRRTDKAIEFLGVPYASPPLDNLRLVNYCRLKQLLLLCNILTVITPFLDSLNTRHFQLYTPLLVVL